MMVQFSLNIKKESILLSTHLRSMADDDEQWVQQMHSGPTFEWTWGIHMDRARQVWSS